MRPADFARGLLQALDASEGRRRKRKRDTTPDAIGLGIKRALLEAAVADDPEPQAFEPWLVERCLEADSPGSARAMALEIFDEWRLTACSPAFAEWLASGAVSEDRSA